jgi:Type II secretory pathway, component PulF
MKDKNEYLLQLSIFIEMGYSIKQAVYICQNIYKDPLLEKMNNYLASGIELIDIFKKLQFDKLWLEYFIFFYQNLSLSKAIKDSLMIVSLKNKLFTSLKKTFGYPLFLLSFAILFSLFSVVVLIPKIKILSSSFSIEASLLQQSLVFIVSFLPYILIFIIILIFIYIIQVIKIVNLQNLDKIKKIMRLKSSKIILQTYFSIKFAIYLQQLVASGYDTKTCIEILNKKIGHSDLKIIIDDIYQSILQGEDINKVIQNNLFLNDYFKITYQLMIESGLIEESLNGFISTSFRLLEEKIKKIVKILLPSIYMFVATIVVMIYMMVVLPMMQLVTSF